MPFADPAVQKAYHAAYRSRNRESIRKNANKYFRANRSRAWAYQLRTAFGITPERYAEMLATQDNRCAICGVTPEEFGRRLAVDHDHKSGRIRGLLCGNCNPALGYFKDDAVRLKKAIQYLGE